VNEMTKIIDSIDIRYKRYQKAKNDGDEMRGLLSDAYYYAAPYRNDFFNKSQGQDEMVDVFDNTAVDGVVRYATNIQSIMMPPYQKFLNLVPGNVLKKDLKNDQQSLDEIKEQLQENTDLFFTNLNNSNFFQASHEALQDMCISTGVLMINEGTRDMPFIFSCVPLSQVYFGRNSKGQIVDFYREWHIKVRNIKGNWPDATLTSELQSKLTNTPDEEVDLIESIIEYPDNSPEFRYYHCVITEKKEEIFKQFMNYSPMIAFRSNVSPNSIYGIGAIIRLLPTIRLLNRLLEDGVAILDWSAFPSWMLTSSAIINPYSISVGANQTFYVRDAQGDAIKLLQPNNNGASQIFEAWVQELQQVIKDTLFLNPLGDVGEAPNQTATEVATRQQNWIRNGGSEFGRLNNELIKPFVKVCFQILRNLGITSDIQTQSGSIEMTINEEMVAIDYASPLLALQNQEDINNMNAYMQNWAGLFGVEFLPTFLDITKIPMWMAEKQNVPLKFLRSEDTIKQMINKLIQATQQQTQPGSQGGAQPAPGSPQQLILPGSNQGQAPTQPAQPAQPGQPNQLLT